MTSPSPRRRQRSTRIVVAVLLIVLSGALVLTATLVGSAALVTASAVAAVVWGAAATKIMHSELLVSRREAARDRAEQAQEYRAAAEARSTEHLAFVSEQRSQLARRAATIRRLEGRLTGTARDLATARRDLEQAREQAATAEAESERLAGRLHEAEERSGEAILRVAELEQELEVLHADWQAVARRAG